MSVGYYSCSAAHVLTSRAGSATSFPLNIPKGLGFQASTRQFFGARKHYVQRRAVQRGTSGARLASVVLALDEAHCKFSITRKLNYGDNMYVLGSSDSLGQWQPDDGQRMTWSEGDGWTLETTIPAGETISFKFAIKSRSGDLLWENTGDRSFILNVGECVALTGEFGAEDSTIITKSGVDTAIEAEETEVETVIEEEVVAKSTPEEEPKEETEKSEEKPEKTLEEEFSAKSKGVVLAESTEEEAHQEEAVPETKSVEAEKNVAVSVLAGLLVTLGLSVGAGLLIYDSPDLLQKPQEMLSSALDTVRT